MDAKRYIIWDELMSEEEEQELVQEFRGNPEYDNMSEDELRSLANDLHSDYLEDEKANLSGIEVPNGLILTGSIQRWNGCHYGALVPENTPDTIAECLRGFCDCVSYLTFYVEDGEFLIREAHHDGTNLYRVRAWKPEIDEDQKDEFWGDFYDGKDIGPQLEDMTFRVGDLIGDVYGWEFAGRPECCATQA